MLVHQAVKRTVLYSSSSSSSSSSSPSTYFSSLLSFSLPSSWSSFSTSTLCSVKPIGALLRMLRTMAGCLVGREDKHWQGTSIVLAPPPPPPYNNQRMGASFDFPTVSLLWQTLQTSNQPLSLLLYVTFSPLSLSPSRQCAGNYEGVSVLQRQTVRELEGRVNGVDRWISYLYRFFRRTRLPPPPHDARSAVRSSEVWHPSSSTNV